MLFQHTAENFIGRQQEIALFQQWLTTPTSPWLLYFYDELEEVEKKGGVGKTWLLRRCAALAKQADPHLTIVMIDFFNVADRDDIAIAERVVNELQLSYPDWSPTAFTRAVHEYREMLNRENTDVIDLKLRLSDALTSDLQKLEDHLLAQNTYLLIFFDTFELIEQDPTIAVLHPLRKFPDNYHFERLRVVFAGRNALDWSHPNWQEREQEVVKVALPPFDLQEMLQYLNMESVYNLHINSAQTIALFKRTEGRPILLGLVKDVLNQRILSLEELVAIPLANFESYLVAQINKLENPLNWIVLFMAHVYHRFNVTLLEWVMRALDMQDLAPYTDQATLQSTLLKLSFVRYPGSGQDFVLHDEMRRLVVKYCWDIQDPDQNIRKEISRNIIEYYQQKIAKEQNEQKRQPYTIEMLYHLLFADIADGLTSFEKSFYRALRLSMYAFARSLFQETYKFWEAMSREQQSDFTLLEVRLLRFEEKPDLALQRCLTLESNDNKIWLTDHYAALILEKGRCYQKLNQFPEAIKWLTESLAIERAQKKESPLRAAILSSLGYLYRRLGLFDLAVEAYTESISLYKKLGYLQDYANNLNNISYVYKIQGKTEEALQKCKIAWRIRSNLFQQGQSSEVLIALSLSTMGGIYFDANDIVQAEAFFNEAFEIYKRIGYRKGIAIMYNRFGQIQMARGNLPLAREWFEKALVASAEVDIEAYVMSLNRQGQLHIMQNEWQEALPFFTEAITLSRQVHNHYQHVESLTDLGEAQACLDLQEQAMESFELAREISLREKYTFSLGRLEEVLGDLNYKASEYRAAFEHYREFCRYMALYNVQEYSSALRKITDRLFNMNQNEILTIADEFLAYWAAQQLDKDYPEVVALCQEVHELLF